MIQLPDPGTTGTFTLVQCTAGTAEGVRCTNAASVIAGLCTDGLTCLTVAVCKTHLMRLSAALDDCVHRNLTAREPT